MLTSRSLGQSSAPLERMCRHRIEAAWLDEQIKASTSRFMVLADLSPVIRSNDARTSASLAWFSPAEVAGFRLPIAEALFLGQDKQDKSVFAICVPEHMARLAPGGAQHLRPIVDLRSLAKQGVLSRDEMMLAGEARSLWSWHLNARHCGHCGGTTRVKDGGWKRKCWACGHEWFPRTDPVVIMLIVDGDRCLLAHEKQFNDNVYSTLAGFIEHGETIEDAVRREVEEETAIKVGEVNYVTSQPWPFPHSLMIGCVGKALTSEITIDPEEIETARWFTRDEAATMLTQSHQDGLLAPGKYAIANWLLQDFIDGKL